MKHVLLTLSGILLSFLPSLHAEVRVEGDGRVLTLANADYEVRFVRENPKNGTSYGWTLATMNYRGHPLIVDIGANETALQLQANEIHPEPYFVGSQHGGEAVKKAVMLIDGKEHPADQPLTVSGQTVEFIKETMVGPYARTSRISLDDAGLREELTFSALKDVSSVAVFYPFMHCLSKSLTEWIAGADAGVSSSGQFLTDDSFTNLGRIKWVGAFSEDRNYGVVVSYGEAYEGRGEAVNRIWNRARDNKLYFWPTIPAGDGVKYTCRVVGFEAEAGNWRQKAEELENHLSKEPQGG